MSSVVDVIESHHIGSSNPTSSSVTIVDGDTEVTAVTNIVTQSSVLENTETIVVEVLTGAPGQDGEPGETGPEGPQGPGATDTTTAGFITTGPQTQAAGDERWINQNQKGAVSGVASLDGSGKVPDNQLPDGIARDSEVTNAINTHTAASDPHSQYLKESDAVVKYASLKALDPRDYGAVGDGTTDDTSAIQACIDAAGANGAVELPALSFKVTGTLILPAGIEFRGVGTKQSRLMVSTDICAVRASGGQGQAVKLFKVWNTFVGPRTTYDMEFISPTKPVVQDVEFDCSSSNTGIGGGLRFYKDAAVTGNSFMPELSRVWGRYATLRIDGVTDGKVSDSYFWASTLTAPGAVQVVNSASSWTFTNVDVVPPAGDFAGYHLDTVENIHIQGGLVDGSYDSILTGWGIRANNCYRLSVRTSFWNLGRGALDLTSVRASSFVGNVISRCNKSDGAYDDIRNTNGIGNVFIGNTHSCLVSRSAPGKMYTESGSSTDNVIDCNVRETGTNYYAATPVTVLSSTYLGPGNRPLAAWPRVLARTVNASETIPQEAIFRGQITYVSGSGVTLTLPSAGTFYTGQTVTVKNTGSSIVTFAASASQTISGLSSISVMPGDAVTIATSTSTAWQIVSPTDNNIVNAQTGTSYTPVLSDANQWVTLNNASAIALTIPTNASVAYPVGTAITFSALGAGQVTVTGSGGVTVNSAGGNKSAAQYAVFEVKKIATDTWILYGRTST